MTGEVLLSKIGDNEFIRNLSVADLRSLDDGKWVTDNFITIDFNNIQRDVDGHNITFVDPNVTQILKKSASFLHKSGNNGPNWI